ncbi:MAG TPA: lytic transglycosylase domain-containing protein [Lachnospiraceae bacterium]|jgi:hypothetical protein|nr:lytic transglycosylase domain-containing protein [Lachnospiraceae bacterium]HCA70701.1 lytic transglycosylase domain-containing protein [Lachnospiraceae bacterium]HCM13939.1 lytic transglycosylase domain-containing protein [Lachnospiraceae bacterium]HCR40437.1 lytic transglycosylase domain-containing protein [Lachnospiraceae bacterium]
MAQVNGIVTVGQQNIYKTNAERTANTDGKSFSAYLAETKSFDDIFEEAANKYNVPVNLLKAIGKAESGFDPKAVSRCGAQGVMQLMPATAASLGVKNAFDPEQNIMGGAKFIAQLLDKYDGNTKLALAAYNAGMGNVAKYGGVPPFKETQNYVVKVMEYMGQNLGAGSVSTAGKQAAPVILPAATSVYNRYYTITPISQMIKEDTQTTLSSIFSEQDYLKFLDLIFKEMDEKKQEKKEDRFQ